MILEMDQIEGAHYAHMLAHSPRTGKKLFMTICLSHGSPCIRFQLDSLRSNIPSQTFEELEAAVAAFNVGEREIPTAPVGDGEEV